MLRVTSYSLIYMIYMTKCCDDEKTGLEILADLQVLSTPEYEKVSLVYHLSVCMCMGVRPHYRLNGWTDFIHVRYSGVYPFTYRCMVNLNVLGVIPSQSVYVYFCSQIQSFTCTKIHMKCLSFLFCGSKGRMPDTLGATNQSNCGIFLEGLSKTMKPLSQDTWCSVFFFF
jgi:hypothetical protein